ncbi:HD domain-containing phosphohydrolase [Nibricoccus sp. IMCC34717]|uniref:HD domain-containing phosphohydrolase n=1 Tax=Nibricoccus sp. IMCC34717 TaxID=3034021 RepID=UPI003850CD7E
MNTAKILFVDDDTSLLAAFQRTFRKDYSFDTASSAAEALAKLASGPGYAVIVADMQMPGMNGIELLSRVRELKPEMVRLMLTGNADQQTATDAVNLGQIFGFLTKPCDPEVLRARLDAALRHHELLRVEKELLEGTLAGSVKVLSSVLSIIDPAAFGRGHKLRESIRTFGSWLGLASTWDLEMAALLCDIGLVSVPPSILRKHENGAELDEREQLLIERSAQIGHDLLISIPRLEPVARIVLYQGKHYSGKGFPSDLVHGEHIPLGSRLLKILHDRAILEADGIVKTKALEQMSSRIGIYDPALLEKCFQCFGTFLHNAISADKPVLSVHTRDLKAGQILVSDVKTTTDVLLVSAGNSLTEIMINRLRNYSSFGEIKEPIYVQ